MKTKIYSDPLHLLRQGNKYFKKREEEGRPFSLIGLSLFLTFSCIDTLESYRKRPEFTDVVNYFRSRIMESYVEKLFQTGTKDVRVNQSSVQFALRSMGMKDVQTIENINTNKTDIDYSKLSKEDTDALDSILKKARK